jgi:hypothetical protein
MIRSTTTRFENTCPKKRSAKDTQQLIFSFEYFSTAKAGASCPGFCFWVGVVPTIRAAASC